MPLIDNRPGAEDPGAGGGGTVDAARDAVKSDWKVYEHTLTALDIANTYITLPNQPQDTKVLVSILGVGPMDKDLDFTVDQPNSRVYFIGDALTRLIESFNTHITVVIKVAYFATTV